MSVVNSILGDLEKCTRKFDELMLLKQKNATNLIEKEKEIEEIFLSTEKNQPEEVAKLIERMHRSEGDDESEIINDFLKLDNGKKQIILKMMEIIWKMGLFEEESDIEKRENWYNLLKSNI